MKKGKCPAWRIAAILLAVLLVCGMFSQGAFPVLAGDEEEIQTVTQNVSIEETTPAAVPNTEAAADAQKSTQETTAAVIPSTASVQTTTAASETKDTDEVTETTAESQTAKEINIEPAESSVNTEAAAEMPALTLSATAANGVSVTASAPEGAFPAGTTMRAEAVSDDTAMRIARSGSAAPENVVDSAGVNITFYNAAGQEIEPQNQKSVQVSMTLASALDGENFFVAHESGDGAAQIAGAGSDSASFAASSFSIYVIYGENNPAIATYRFIGADGSALSEQKVKNGETVYAPETPEKAGYIFSGWTLTDGSGNIDLQTFDTLNAEVTKTETLTYYPVFTKCVHVFFMESTDSDARIYLTRTVKTGETVDVDAVVLPHDAQHGITGWYTDPSLTPESRVSSVTAGEEDIVLYPDIQEGHYITYETGSDASVINPVFVAEGELTSAPADPTRAGYTFNGFATTPDAAAPDFTFGGTLDLDITLYALWTPGETTYTVIIWKQSVHDDRYAAEEDRTYDYAQSEQRSATVGETVSADTNDTGKNFTGFHFSRSTTAVASADGKTVVNVYYDRNLITLYFKTQTDEDYCEPWYGLFGQPFSQYGYQWIDVPGVLWSGTKNGYRGFFNLTEFDMSQYTDSDTYTFYYCEKTPSQYKVRFYLQNVTGDGYTQAYEGTILQNYQINAFNFYEGYHIAYYRTDSTENGVTTWSEWKSTTDTHNSLGRNCNIEVRFDLNTYNFNYYSYNSQVNSEEIKYKASLAALEDYVPDRPEELPEYYSFQGWYKDTACTEAFDFSESMPAYDVTVYAKWAPKECTVTAGNTVLTVLAGSKLDPDTLPGVAAADGTVIEATSNSETVTVPAGQTWGGWAVLNSDGSRQLFNIQSIILDDTVLTPYFIDGRSVHVTYSVSGNTDLVKDSRSFVPGAMADVLSGSNVTAPAGKVFLYWSTSEDGSGDSYYPGETVNVGEGITLYAVFGDTAATTVLTYHNGAETTQQKVNGSTDLTNNTAFALYTFADTGFTARAGERFAGWNTKEDGSGQHFDPGTQVGVDNLSSNDLYAEWVKDEVKANDNTTTTSNVSEAAYISSPNTGDNSYIWTWLVVCVCAVLAAGLLVKMKVSDKRE
ncbi:MAG: InlB B-repeat-containing protein [Lachnospiraceae bacterium]|jgi:uncharacterized repeat protein (TIGR02543 family)